MSTRPAREDLTAAADGGPAATGGRRRGRPASGARPAGEPDTRDRILASARTEFAASGYDRASVRAIARGAEVDSALVHHYFGTKEQVFAAAVEGALAAAFGAPDVVGDDSRYDMGERLVRFMFSVWEDERTREPVLAVVRSAVSNETAAAVFRRLITRHMTSRIAREVDTADAELRVELAVAQLVGVAMLRYVIKVEPIASEDPEELITRLAPVVQGHLAY